MYSSPGSSAIFVRVAKKEEPVTADARFVNRCLLQWYHIDLVVEVRNICTSNHFLTHIKACPLVGEGKKKAT